MAARPTGDHEATLNLTLAVVASSDAPALLLESDLRVLAASMSFCVAFQIDPASAPGRLVFELGAEEWDDPRLRSLLNATLSSVVGVEAYEMDLDRPGQAPRRLVLKAQRLAEGDAGHSKVLLTVLDVTDARAAEKFKDDLLREKAVLLQEVQHRVANSLQIIASVLLQSARKVNSEETRGHLRDAHHRVMSIAAVQHHLAASRVGEVELRPYFIQLCQSIAASMIHDHEQLSLEVAADESTVMAEVSVSFGLIVTELIINALKHAFPDGRSGKVSVDYKSQGPNWALSVSDNGVGISREGQGARPGLGTSIVEALAKQLRADVRIADGHPGTVVSIVHTEVVAANVVANLEPTPAAASGFYP